MSILRRVIAPRYRSIISEWLYKPVEWLMSLLDLILLPLQKLIGIRRMAYFFVAPNLLVFGIFVLLPMMLNFAYGFTSGRSILLENREYVKTENFDKLLDCDDYRDPQSCSEDYFWYGIHNTIFFVFAQVGSMIVLALLTAIILNQQIVMRGFFRSVFFYPVLLSPVVVALIWKWILKDDYGLLNIALEKLGQEPQHFLSELNWAKFWVIAVSNWAQMGFFTLILLAGLQSIPASLYEAAEIDGANAWQRFLHVTMPLLMPTMTVVFVLAFIRAVQAFDQIYVLTGGGPGTTGTKLIVQYIYEQAFQESPTQYGRAAAASLMLAVVLMILTLTQLFFARRNEAA